MLAANRQGACLPVIITGRQARGNISFSCSLTVVVKTFRSKACSFLELLRNNSTVHSNVRPFQADGRVTIHETRPPSLGTVALMPWLLTCVVFSIGTCRRCESG